MVVPPSLLLPSSLPPPLLLRGAGGVSSMVSVAVDGDPVPNGGLREPKDRLTVSSSLSESSVVEMVNDLELSPERSST